METGYCDDELKHVLREREYVVSRLVRQRRTTRTLILLVVILLGLLYVARQRELRQIADFNKRLKAAQDAAVHTENVYISCTHGTSCAEQTAQELGEQLQRDLGDIRGTQVTIENRPNIQTK